MFRTNYGDFDPDSWEEKCQVAFKAAYKKENYQKMPDANGDLGIEGFTLKTGKVFQCYCPENNIRGQDLYKALRGKITSDIGKLSKNCSKLKKILGQTKISEWYLVTPKNADKNIFSHCRKKEKEILEKNLDIIDHDFKIIIHEIEDYIQLFKFTKEGIHFTPELKEEDRKLSEKESTYVENAKRKYTKMYDDDFTDLKIIEDSTDKATKMSVGRYLKGKKTIAFLRVNHPRDYERFKRLISQMEEEVEFESLGKILNKKMFLKDQTNLVYKRLTEHLKGFDEIMIRSLAHQVVSRWILECPLNFI